MADGSAAVAVETLEVLPHFSTLPNPEARPVEEDAATMLSLQAVGVPDPVAASSVGVGTMDALPQDPTIQVGPAVGNMARSLSSRGAVVKGVVSLLPPHPNMAEAGAASSDGALVAMRAAQSDAGALERAGLDPFGWGGLRLAWENRADLEAAPVFVLDDVEEQDF